MSDVTAALLRLRELVENLENVLPGPEILAPSHVADAAGEVVTAFDELDRLLHLEGGAETAARGAGHGSNVYVLLIDSDDSTALIGCPDAATAERVASAAVFNDGDVSAWLVPGTAIVDVDKVVQILKNAGDCEAILDADLRKAPRV